MSSPHHGAHQTLPSLGYSHPQGSQNYASNATASSTSAPSSPLQPVRSAWVEENSYADSPKYLKQEQSPSQQGTSLALYPMSVGILTVWIAFIAALVWLLERCVMIGPSVAVKPWKYDILPALLLTAFSQGHVAVTAMHLSRLAISGLHRPRSSPNTWAELCWSANKNWQGPVGVGSTLIGMIKMRVRISPIYIMFALCSLFALATPLVLTRAYPILPLDVAQPTALHFNVTESNRWRALDLYSQIGLGSGLWSSGRGVFSYFNTTTYVLPGASRVDDVGDIFVSGDVIGMRARLPGIRLNGSCSVDTDHSGLSPEDSLSQFKSRCEAQKWGFSSQSGSEPRTSRFYDGWSRHLSCSPFGSDFVGWEPVAPAFVSSLEALSWFSARNTTSPDRYPAFTQGLVKCSWSMQTGKAEVDGRNGTFTQFTNEWNTTGTGGEPPTHPLRAALAALENMSSNMTTNAYSGYQNGIEEHAWQLRMGIGMYTQTGVTDGTSVTFHLPTLGGFATRMSVGVAYMAHAMSILTTTDEILYPATAYIPSTARMRSSTFAAGGYALLGLWFASMLILTGFMYRPTFGPSLDSYVIGRLLADEPKLVHGHCCGQLENNNLMTAQFHGVGDSRSLDAIGHVTSGGRTPLTRTREYGLS